MNTFQNRTHLSTLSTLAALLVSLVVADSAMAQPGPPVCGPPPPPPAASKWRIRNAAIQANSGQWVIREMDFCADTACTQTLSGTAFDSGDSRTWSPPENAFDGDTSTLWKTFDTDVVGQSYIGLDFGAPTSVRGLYIKTDNVVYSVDSIYVDYYDDNLGEWITADIIHNIPHGSELTYEIEIRQSFPTSWRIRNASVQANSGQWVIREMDFCADTACTQTLSGTAFDSGDSRTWSPPSQAFDGDTSTFWKTFDTDVAGQSYIGQDFSSITDVRGLYIKTDNVVYSVDSIYVEYYDALAADWITADIIDNIPSGSELTYEIKIRQSFPMSWRIRNASVQANSGQWVIREMDFCADPGCTETLAGDTTFDSGDSRDWSLPSQAFDDDTSTFWKTFDTDVAGQSYIGQDFSSITDILGLYIKTDNVVYSVDSIYVEYYDALAADWIIAETLTDVPSGSELTYPICP